DALAGEAAGLLHLARHALAQVVHLGTRAQDFLVRRRQLLLDLSELLLGRIQAGLRILLRQVHVVRGLLLAFVVHVVFQGSGQGNAAPAGAGDAGVDGYPLLIGPAGLHSRRWTRPAR